MRLLIIIEELGSLSSSAAITNWNLAKIIGDQFKKADIFTLDNIDIELQKEWSCGQVYQHPKNNLKPYQKIISKISKLLAVFQIVNGNSFGHQNRIASIRNFLKLNRKKYNTVILLSGGFGFTPHQAIKKKKLIREINVIGVFHDPYPSSSYPEPYRKGNRIFDYFRRRNIQKSINNINHVVFPSQRLYEWYLNDYKIDSNSVTIIPHAVNFIKHHKPADLGTINIKITHTGTLLEQRNPKIFLEVFRSIENNNSELHFFGNINPKVAEELAAFSSVENVFINNFRIPYSKAVEELSSSHFLLLIEADGEDNPFLPTKFVDYICLDLPIIILSPKKSEVTRLVGDKYPFISELNDSIKIKEILTKRIDNQKEIEKSLSILKSLKRYFSKDYILESYKAMIEE